MLEIKMRPGIKIYRTSNNGDIHAQVTTGDEVLLYVEYDSNTTIDLCSKNLSWSNMNGIVLRGAKLRYAQLLGADLSHSDLREADLESASLSLSNLKWAQLADANLKNSDMSGVQLQGANLKGANLSNANLYRVEYDDTTQWPNGFDTALVKAVVKNLTKKK